MFDRRGDIVSKAQFPFRQLYPQPGWVEHDPGRTPGFSQKHTPLYYLRWQAVSFAAFFREYGVTTLLAAPFSKRINQGFIAVDDPTHYTDDPVFLFIASYAVVVELNEIKQQQSLLAATKASKYNPEDIHINFFGGMEIISSKGTLTGEDIKADQCYLLLAYLILNHKKNFSVDTLAEIICPYDELDSPYKAVNNIVYRLRRTLSVIGLDKLVIGKNDTFQINPNFNIHTDFDRFEDACIQLKTEENPDMRHF